MTLAALANNQDERAAFQRIKRNYPKTTKGYLQALQEFTPLYISALKGSISLKSIGLSELANKRASKNEKLAHNRG